MRPEDAAKKLSFHLVQCGALMPMDWIKENGEGSELQQAFKMALDALASQEKLQHKVEDLKKNLENTKKELEWRNMVVELAVRSEKKARLELELAEKKRCLGAECPWRITGTSPKEG